MKFTAQSAVPFAVAALAASAQAEDALYSSLYSSRVSKRGLDAQGNFNVCKSPRRSYLVSREFLTHVIQPSSTSTMFMLIWTSTLLQALIAPTHLEDASVVMHAFKT